MNKVILKGRLTKDPQVEYVKCNDKDIARCRFTLALNRTGNKDKTDFIPCIVWNKSAENLAKYQNKGNSILISGRVQTDNYKDKNGNDVYTTYIQCEDIEYIDKKQSDDEPKNEQPKEEKKQDGWGSAKDIEIDPEELPFY